MKDINIYITESLKYKELSVNDAFKYIQEKLGVAFRYEKVTDNCYNIYNYC